MKHLISGRALWRPALVLMILVGVLIFLKTAFLVPRDVETLLGIPLPDSTNNVQVEIRDRSWGAYDAFVRFELAPQDVSRLLSDPAFQPRRASTDPMEVFQGASFGQRASAPYSAQQRPSWWQPKNGRLFMLANRSRLGPGHSYSGPDAAWYMVDTSSASVTIVYVFIAEV